MAMKKKKKHPHIDKSPVRKRKAKAWVQKYAGTDIVKDYREHFKGVDVTCAVRELREIGYKFEPDYEKNVLGAESARIEHLHRKKENRQQSEAHRNEFQDDNFYFIAGYTSGGAPYGIQWWEMNLEPWENEYDDEYDSDEVIGSDIYYDSLSESEKNSVKVFQNMSMNTDDFQAKIENKRLLSRFLKSTVTSDCCTTKILARITVKS